MSVLEIPVDNDQKPKRKTIPKGLEERLGKKKQQQGKNITERLAAAEERRKDRLADVKQKAIETRAVLMQSLSQANNNSEKTTNMSPTPTTQNPTQLREGDTTFVSSATPEFWNMTHAVAIHQWTEQLRKHSMESVLIPLNKTATTVLSGGDSDTTSSDAKSHLSKLEADLDDAIKSFGNEAFVKLSSRSGKDDAILQCSPQSAEYLKTLLDNADIASISSSDLIANQEAVAVMKTVSHSLVMKSGKQVLTHFSGSSRIATDLRKSLLYPTNNMHVIVRRFSQDIKPSNEWRCFIRDGRLTAVSQYHHHCFFEEHPVNVKSFIEEFVGKIIPLLPVVSCVADVCCDVSEGTAQLIEINPFHYTTEGCLYDWVDPGDLSILTASSGVVSFRRRTVPSHAAASKHVSRSYQTVIDAWRYERSLELIPSPPRGGS
eukprot:TRINITY_DN11256_c1_g3_i1.p1 TRINITY_DN11256_c1_g3~~TRINITY_DN11256_c1_g3_i1.p1  ORF type:complete len:432 (+),score=76.30 TRINITY_DN11256_c1_g3_i1:1216-2511(+)